MKCACSPLVLEEVLLDILLISEIATKESMRSLWWVGIGVKNYPKEVDSEEVEWGDRKSVQSRLGWF